MKKRALILLFTCACVCTRAQVNIITTIAGTDSAGYCCDNGPSTNAKLNHPNQISVDNFGNLYISDAFNHRIRKIVLSSGIITTVAGTGASGYNGDSIQATNAQLFVPDAVATDTFGNIYIADALNYRVRKIVVSTGTIYTIVGNGIAGNTGDGGLATNAQIGGICGLSIDKSGNLFLADNDNNIIRKVTTAGIITTIAGNNTLGYSGDGGLATNAQFNEPSDMWVDNIGNIVISDCFNHAIRKVDAVTGIVTTIAGNGVAGYSGDTGPAVNAKLNDPYGVYIDDQNNVFFAEWGNGVIREIKESTGIISTVVGHGVQGFSGDGGPATDAKLMPDDVFIGSNGVMYVADYTNNRIRVVYNPKLGVTPLNLSSGNVLVYPNPTNSELNVTGLQENTNYRLLSIAGASMQQGILQQGSNKISMKDIASGTYILEMTDADGQRNNVRVFKN